MVGRLMFLVDTNVWLELILDQEKAADVRRFFQAHDTDDLSITEFSLYSIGIILSRLKKDEAFVDFLTDTLQEGGVKRVRLDIQDLMLLSEIIRRFNLDFDDAYQYCVAQKFDMVLVSFDGDFDGTERGRKAPADV